jgi:hypothetical protein
MLPPPPAAAPSSIRLSPLRSPDPAPARPPRFVRRIPIAIVDCQGDMGATTEFFAHAARVDILKSD